MFFVFTKTLLKTTNSRRNLALKLLRAKNNKTNMIKSKKTVIVTIVPCVSLRRLLTRTLLVLNKYDFSRTVQLRFVNLVRYVFETQTFCTNVKLQLHAIAMQSLFNTT